ncbi:MAG: hypothetical protein WCB31_02515 [Nitrososphaeraceae archaeon]
MLKTNKIVFNLISVATFFILVATSLGSSFVQIYSQEQVQQNQQSSIQLTGKLIDNIYRWVDSSNNSINPTLNITAGVDNQITVKSLKDDPEEHEMIIEGITSDGDKEELVKSDEVQGGSSDTIVFNPEDLQEEDKNYQSIEYYCEYHPDTMKGKIKLATK